MMLRYIIRRTVQIIPTLLGVSILSFSLLYVFPGDPAELIVRISAGVDNPTPEMIEKFRIESGLDKPIVLQYFNWLSHIVRGDFGVSWTSGKPVLEEILERFPASAVLFFSTFLISIIFAFLLGIVAALYRDRLMDHITRIWALLGISIPSFWLGLMLIWLFSVRLHLLPSFGFGTLKHAILPVLTWSMSFMAIKTRFVRASLLDALSQDYVLTARSKGLSDGLIVFRHALRNALIPIITYLSMSMGHLIVGSVMIEVVFAWPGLGSYLVSSVFRRDFPVVQALVLLSGVMFTVMNLIVDILYAIIDPRIRYGG